MSYLGVVRDECVLPNLHLAKGLIKNMSKITQFKIKNYCETLVFDRIKSMPDVYNRGSDFVNDVACIALNTIRPHYVREKIFLFFYITDSDWETLIVEVAESVDFAVQYVEENLKHR